MGVFSKGVTGVSISASPKSLKPIMQIIPRSEHSISRSDISENALKVLYRLKKHNFEAYLVGGGVRDLLLGHHPKDFDVVTDAHPEQIRSIFNNCRLIGRRFRLAHVFFGHDIVEVATFRGKSVEEKSFNTSTEGMLLRDNVYGTLQEDVWRRDFTVNAIYYNIKDFSLVDYTGGLKDIEERVIRIIGEPSNRLREDPVRMLRAIRFSCKLNFTLAENLSKSMHELGNLLKQVPSARLFEEVIKIFHSGHALAIFRQLRFYKLLSYLFPTINAVNDENKQLQFIENVLQNTDDRILNHLTANPAFLFAALLWHPLQHCIEQMQENHSLSRFSATLQAMEQILHAQRASLSFPRRLSIMMKEIWILQIRLERCAPKQVKRITNDPRFKSAYDFLLLRYSAQDVTQEIIQWWQNHVPEEDYTHKPYQKSKKRRGSKRKKKPLDQDFTG
ncbi:MAG TPA: polynucleotide adenylyltransferase PcnB [Gammaproteobacteria bacterium]|nr:polynucleotide adenylyltransferase PcnB [Gammaproteobacteria bacterium]